MSFIPDMLLEVINRDNAVVMFPDRSGNVYRYGKNISFDPLECPTWKIALRNIHAEGIKPCACLMQDPDTLEVGWVVLEKSMSTKERTKIKTTVQKLTSLTFDPDKVAEDREKVAILKYFVTKDKFQRLYEQSEEIAQVENTPMRLLFSSIKPETPLPDTLIAEFTVIREQQQKTQELFNSINNQSSDEQPKEETYDSMPWFDVLTVAELRDYCKANNIHSVPSNAKKKEVFLTHIKKFYSALTV